MSVTTWQSKTQYNGDKSCIKRHGSFQVDKTERTGWSYKSRSVTPLQLFGPVIIRCTSQGSGPTFSAEWSQTGSKLVGDQLAPNQLRTR